MKLRVGLVGLGGAWENCHRSALRALGDRFQVVAVCESVTHRASLAAAEFQASVVEGFRVLANREDVDAVVVLSDQWFGPLPILAACDSGKAIYCSSEVELKPDVASDVKRRVEQSGVAFYAEFPLRQAPATLRLKELIATRLGQPQLVFCHHRTTRPVSNGKIRSGSPAPRIVDMVDWCRYIAGREATSVLGMAHTASTDPQVEDYQMMSLDFSEPGRPGTGTVAQISSGSYISDAYREAETFRPPAALQVACEQGIAFMDLPSTLIWFDGAGHHMESLDSERAVGEQLLLHFHRAVTSLVRNTASLDDAYRAQYIAAQARHSFDTGSRVPLV